MVRTERWQMVRTEKWQCGQIDFSSSRSKYLWVSLEWPILRQVRMTSIFYTSDWKRGIFFYVFREQRSFYHDNDCVESTGNGLSLFMYLSNHRKLSSLFQYKNHWQTLLGLVLVLSHALPCLFFFGVNSSLFTPWYISACSSPQWCFSACLSPWWYFSAFSFLSLSLSIVLCQRFFSLELSS